jgi:hypothetical protein
MALNAKKRSSARNEYDSDDGFVASDSDAQGRSKRVKTKNASDTSSSTQKVDSNGDVYWQISNLRRVTISTFRGKTMVNIREYYEKDGQELPGKKVSCNGSRVCNCMPANSANLGNTGNFFAHGAI